MYLFHACCICCSGTGYGHPRPTAAHATFPLPPSEHQSNDSQLKSLRLGMRDLKKEYEKSEDDLKNLQCVGQIVGEVLRQVLQLPPPR